MAFPPQYREVAPTLPSIRIPGSDHRRAQHDMHYASSPAMSIPGVDSRCDAPPPLPPPRFLPFAEVPHHPGEIKHDRREPKHGSSSLLSGYGSMHSSFADDRPAFKRRDTGSTNGDEGYASYASTDRSRESLPAEPPLHHNKFYFQSPADLHCDSMIKKLDPIRTLDKSSPPRPALNTAVCDFAPRGLADARGLSSTMSIPIHSRGGGADYPPRHMDAPPYSAAISPRSAHFHHTPIDQRSPIDGSDVDRSPRRRYRRNNSDDAGSTQSNYDYHGVEDMDMEETSSLRRLQIEDGYAAVGQKRRAASPPPADVTISISGQIDGLRRREIGSRGSPTPRLSTIPQGASLSPLSSTTASRSNSYMSTSSMPLSNINTAASSYDARSPGGISPTSCSSPYTMPASLNHSPKTTMSRGPALHHRNVSGSSPRKLPDMHKPSAKLQGFFMCECCPKKPKKFDTAEELRTHQAEKQYKCLFCGNRFKNKNEAERHQNSLHVRSHSWSCSALSGYERAFHESTNRPGEADTCGYCGDEFPRSGRGAGNGALSGGIVPRQATDQDLEERVRHLQEVHKFRECNSSKKFFRADHFRQHLKHSHAGTSGKWTNMLENACMLDEDPTPR